MVVMLSRRLGKATETEQLWPLFAVTPGSGSRQDLPSKRNPVGKEEAFPISQLCHRPRFPGQCRNHQAPSCRKGSLPPVSVAFHVASHQQLQNPISSPPLVLAPLQFIHNHLLHSHSITSHPTVTASNQYSHNPPTSIQNIYFDSCIHTKSLPVVVVISAHSV